MVTVRKVIVQLVPPFWRHNVGHAVLSFFELLSVSVERVCKTFKQAIMTGMSRTQRSHIPAKQSFQ